MGSVKERVKIRIRKTQNFPTTVMRQFCVFPFAKSLLSLRQRKGRRSPHTCERVFESNHLVHYHSQRPYICLVCVRLALDELRARIPAYMHRHFCPRGGSDAEARSDDCARLNCTRNRSDDGSSHSEGRGTYVRVPTTEAITLISVCR